MTSRRPISVHSTIAVILLASLTFGFVFGGGLHGHDALSHEHGQVEKHSHGWTFHSHEEVIGSSVGTNRSVVEREESRHYHPVPVYQIIAVTTTSPLAGHVISLRHVAFAALPQFTPTLADLSMLLCQVHEVSPPPDEGFALRIPGRSPPLI